MTSKRAQISLDPNYPVAIFGMGVTGRGASELLSKAGYDWVGYDTSTAYVSWSFEYAASHKAAIVSPGFPVNHPWLAEARKAGITLYSEIDLAAQFWPGRLVAVTGTNGKTTLTEFLAKVFAEAEYGAVAVGNIGNSFARTVARGQFDERAVAVCEMSSFQAEQTETVSWDGVIWTNFAEDHLERHGDMETYFRAKARLLASVTEDAPIVLGRSVSEYARKFQMPLPVSCFDGDLDIDEDIPRAFQSAPQQRNYRKACVFWRLWGGSMMDVRSAAAEFELPEHRLQKLPCASDSISFWNDSKATNFAATLAALESLPEQPVIWIGGGLSKGGDIQGFADRLSRKITTAVLLGEEPRRFKAALEIAGVSVHLASDMIEAVNTAIESARNYPAAHVLLSPGFSSLDQFQGYAHRGRAFSEAVDHFFESNLISNPI